MLIYVCCTYTKGESQTAALKSASTPIVWKYASFYVGSPPSGAVHPGQLRHFDSIRPSLLDHLISFDLGLI